MHDLSRDPTGLSGDPPAVSLLGVTRRFASAGGVVTALDDVALDAAPRQFTAVGGPSGSGKSTLLAIVACTDRADSGHVVVAGTDVQRMRRGARRMLRRRALGLVLPVPADNLLDSLDATGNLRWAAERRTGQRLSDDAVDELLATVDLGHRRHRRVAELSGGEQQRLALLCALVGAPRVVLADEPTALLDRDSAALVVAALRAAADRGATLLVASHDEHVLHAADTVVHLDHGRRTS